MKQTYYFSHDSNARTDDRILSVRAKHGTKGYGIYFMIIEMLREANAYQMPTNYPAIAYELHESETDVEDIVKNYKLFEIKDGYFWSESLKKRMIKAEEVTQKRIEAGRKGGLSSRSMSSKHQANAKQMLSKDEANTKQLKESKLKENKEKESKEIIESTKVDAVDTAVSQYGNQNVNKILEAIKAKVGIEDFRESKPQQRIWGQNLYKLMEKITPGEFSRRLDVIRADDFKSQNCGSLQYLYKEIKSFIEPKSARDPKIIF